MANTNAKRGLDIIISIGENVLGGQRGATLNRSSEVIDITNKVSGGWTENLTSVKSWSVDCDGIFVVNDTALDAIESAFLNSYIFYFNIVYKKQRYTGKAVITDFPIEAAYDDAATYSLTLEGTGALAKITDQHKAPSGQPEQH